MSKAKTKAKPKTETKDKDYSFEWVDVRWDTFKNEIIDHCDAKISAWCKLQEEKTASHRKALEAHSKQVEKFLALMVKALNK